MDLESLKREIENEIQTLDEHRSALLEKLVHLKALEPFGMGPEAGIPAGPQGVTMEEPASADYPSHQPPEHVHAAEMLAALRCLKCGASLERLIPRKHGGEPNIENSRLGKSNGGQRYLECPQCLAKNIFVRTTGPRGWRLLVTQLMQ